MAHDTFDDELPTGNYLADRSNAAVDVVDAKANRFVKQIRRLLRSRA